MLSQLSKISNFDNFEYYLYFQSGSLTTTTQYGITPWPKSSSTLPYILYNSTSSQVSNWYASASINAADWDTDNYNNLLYAVPSFITEDPNNSQYLLFLNMIGQYFDSIWVYLKAVTDINLANNNLNDGISRDIVYTQLQSLGIDVHNSLGNQFLSNFLLGANTGSTTYTGTSSDDFSYTSSFLNNIPRKDLLAESYKRIYHNLPLLLKKKGTASGLSDLISTFDMKILTKQLGHKKLKFVESETMMEMLKVPKGCVTVFAIMNMSEDNRKKTTVLIDTKIVNGFVNFHPLRNDATTTVHYDSIKQFVESYGVSIMLF